MPSGENTGDMLSFQSSGERRLAFACVGSQECTAEGQMVTVWEEAELSALGTGRLHADVLCGLEQRGACLNQERTLGQELFRSNPLE